MEDVLLSGVLRAAGPSAARGRRRESAASTRRLARAAPRSSVEVRQLHREHRGLERVEPRIHPDPLVNVALHAAMCAQHPHALAIRSSVLSTMPASPAAPRFFDGKNEKAPNKPYVPAMRTVTPSPVGPRADRLRRVFDDRRTVGGRRIPSSVIGATRP